MLMVTTDAQKQQAIEIHSLQAGEFASSYVYLNTDVYSACFRYSRHRLDAWLARYLPRKGTGLSLLDVGCGTGHHMASLRRRGFRVAGLDGSEAMLEHSRANNPGADIRLADVEDVPFPSESFDYVLCIEVLRYLPDPTRCIKEIARVLKPGGTCLVTAAPRFNLNGYWVINRIATLMPMGNLVRLKQFFTTSGRLRREFAAAGFEQLAVHGVYIGPVNWIEHIVPRALPRVLRAWEHLDARLADLPLLRQFSNMFLVKAVKK